MDHNGEVFTARLLHDGTLLIGAVSLYQAGIVTTAGFLATMCVLGCALVTVYIRVQQAKTAKLQNEEAKLRLAIATSDAVKNAAKVVLDTAVDTAKTLLETATTVNQEKGKEY